MTLQTMRAKYRTAELLEGAATDPRQLLQQWIDEAVQAQVVEANAMTLSTVTPSGQPRARAVLLRRLDERGLVFFTNYDSDKAHELGAEAKACLSFLWTEVARQVRVEGLVTQVEAAESDEYFASRPRGHQIGAWASEQSRVIASRAVLEKRAADIEKRFAGLPIPRPPFWGGFRLTPGLFEFWQGRENRLHDRLRFTRDSGGWRIERLSP